MYLICHDCQLQISTNVNAQYNLTTTKRKKKEAADRLKQMLPILTLNIVKKCSTKRSKLHKKKRKEISIYW